MTVAGILHQREWQGRRYLVSPTVDFLLAGGIAFFLIPLLFLAFPVSADGTVDGYDLFYTSIFFAVMAYLVNHPHFMVSYQLMYQRYPEKLKKHRADASIYWRYILAGIVVPVALLLYLIYAFIDQSRDVFAIGVHVLFFTVGWHYVKQAFGVFVMLSALKQVYYSPFTRRILLINCMVVWILSWLEGNIWVPGYEKESEDYYGVEFYSLDLGIPPYVIELLKGLVIFYGIASALAIAMHAIRTGARPSLTALAGYSSMYTLMLLAYYHPLWVYMTPLWHSAQYLLFVWAYKRGERQYLIDHGEMQNEEARERLRKFVLISFLMGILMFTGVPRTLEWLTGDVALALGILLPFLYGFDIFINIHHYFIDNVIWRKQNKEVGQYVFYRGAEA